MRSIRVCEGDAPIHYDIDPVRILAKVAEAVVLFYFMKLDVLQH